MVSCNFTNKANSHTPEVAIHKRQKIMPFWPLCCLSDTILSKILVPITWAGVFLWENFHSAGLEINKILKSHLSTKWQKIVAKCKFLVAKSNRTQSVDIHGTQCSRVCNAL